MALPRASTLLAATNTETKKKKLTKIRFKKNSLGGTELQSIPKLTLHPARASSA